MAVDLDVVHVATAHSPYLVPPECGYTTKVLTTPLQLREAVSECGSGKKVKLSEVKDLPYDIAAAKRVYTSEVESFRPKYRVSE
jgi:hypothetical protein